MRIVISEFISLDGVVQAPGGPEEDTDGGFAHGGWSHPFFDPEVVGGAFAEATERADALLFGRRTWRTMANAWPERAGDPFADRMNALPKYVVSNTSARPTSAGTTPGSSTATRPWTASANSTRPPAATSSSWAAPPSSARS